MAFQSSTKDAEAITLCAAWRRGARSFGFPKSEFIELLSRCVGVRAFAAGSSRSFWRSRPIRFGYPKKLQRDRASVPCLRCGVLVKR